MVKKPRLKTKDDSLNEKTFVAYIVKGNRQIIKRDVAASKRFLVDGNMYTVRDECIFYKNIDGRLRSVCYYRENNPNPYDFKKKNIGLTDKELDDFFAEDLVGIVNDIEPENRSIYILIMSVISLAVNLVFMIYVLLAVFVL
jgi:hypothetical protein